MDALLSIPVAHHLDIRDLLEFVDECDLSDTENNQQQKRSPSIQEAGRPRCPSNLHVLNKGSRSTTRPRRDVVEISELKSQLADLILELENMKQNRSASAGQSGLLLKQTPHWYPEADRQSKLRAAAQKENEWLKAKTHAQMKIAKRFVNVLKRSSTNQVSICSDSPVSLAN